jgi:hypothetical protein
MKVIIEFDNLSESEFFKKENILGEKEELIKIIKIIELLAEYKRKENKNIYYDNLILNKEHYPFLINEKIEEFKYRISNNKYILDANLKAMKELIIELRNNIKMLELIKEIFIYYNYPNIFYDIIEYIDNNYMFNGK